VLVPVSTEIERLVGARRGLSKMNEIDTTRGSRLRDVRENCSRSLG